MSIYSKMISRSGAYAVALLAQRVASLLLLPLYTRTFNPSDYGILELISTAMLVVEMLLGLRLGDAMYYGFSKAATPRDKNVVVASTLIAMVLLGALLLVVGFPLAPYLSILVFQHPRYANLFQISLVGTVLGLSGQIGFSYLRAIDNVWHYNVVSIARLGLTIVLNVFFLVVLKTGFVGILWSTTLATGVVTLYLVGLLLVKNGLILDLRILWSQLRFAAPLAASGVVLFVFHNGDRFVLVRSATLRDVGIYSLAYKFAMLVSFVGTPFMYYWAVQIFEIAKGSDGNQIQARVFTYYTAVSTLVAVGLSLYAYPIFKITTTPEYFAGAAYVPWLAGAYVIRGMSDHLRLVFQLKGRPSFDARVTFTAGVVIVALYLVLIPRYGAMGAVAATLLGFTCLTGIAYYYSQRLFPCPYEWKRLTLLAFISVVVVAAGSQMAPLHFYAQVGCATLLFGVWCGLVLATRFLRPNEQAELLLLIKVPIKWLTVRATAN